MKISKKDFTKMKSKYDDEVKKGKPGKGKNGREKTDQANWFFFDRETLERLLAKADKDPKVGGIQFYLTEYTEETAKECYPDDPEQYVGQMTLVMRAANLKANKLKSVHLDGKDDEYESCGHECPFVCEPEPTDV